MCGRVVNLTRLIGRRGGGYGGEVHSTRRSGLDDLRSCTAQPVATVLAEPQAVGVVDPAAITPSHTLKGNPAGTTESRELSSQGRASRLHSPAGLGCSLRRSAGQRLADRERRTTIQSGRTPRRERAWGGRPRCESPESDATTVPRAPGFPWLFPTLRCAPGRTRDSDPPAVGLRRRSSPETRTGDMPMLRPPLPCC